MSNTLRPVWLLVLSLVLICFEGVPARPYISGGDMVKWKVLAEYSWSPTTTWSGSLLVLQLVLHLIRVVTGEVRYIHELLKGS